MINPPEIEDTQKKGKSKKKKEEISNVNFDTLVVKIEDILSEEIEETE